MTLRVIYSKRDKRQYFSEESTATNLTINGTEFSFLSIEGMSLTRLSVTVDEKTLESLKKIYENTGTLSIRCNKPNLQIDGCFFMDVARRTAGDTSVVNFDLDQSNYFEGFDDVIPPSTLLNQKNYRLLKLKENYTEDLDIYSELIKDIKSSKRKILVDFFFKGNEVTRGYFDFSSLKKQITSLEFEIKDGEIGLLEGQIVQGKFVFIGQIHFFSTVVKGFDTDFNIVEVDQPKSLVIANSRQYLRSNRRMPIVIGRGSTSIETTIEEFDVKGGVLNYLMDIGTELSINFLNPSYSFQAKIFSTEEDKSFFQWQKNISFKKNFQTVFLKSLNEEYEARAPENYEKYINSAMSYGYEFSSNREKELFIKDWSEIDTESPANVVSLGKSNEKYCSSLGTYALTNKTQMIHSGFMEKSKLGAESFLTILQYMFNFQHLNDDYEFFCSPFFRDSRFTTRMFLWTAYSSQKTKPMLRNLLWTYYSDLSITMSQPSNVSPDIKIKEAVEPQNDRLLYRAYAGYKRFLISNNERVLAYIFIPPKKRYLSYNQHSNFLVIEYRSESIEILQEIINLCLIKFSSFRSHQIYSDLVEEAGVFSSLNESMSCSKIMRASCLFSHTENLSSLQNSLSRTFYELSTKYGYDE